MAKNVAINIKIDTGNGIKTLDNLKVGFEDVYGEVRPLTTQLGELEDILYQMAAAGQEGTDAFKAIQKEVAASKKIVQETDKVIDAMSQTLGGKLGLAASGVAGAFGAAQGAIAIFGGESKAVEKTLVKLQAAMAIQQGLASFRESIPVIKQFGASIAAAAATQYGLVAAQTASGNASIFAAAKMRILNLVMNANPILLVVTAVGALVGALAFFSSSSETAEEKTARLNKAQEKLNERINQTNESVKRLTASYVSYDKLLTDGSILKTQQSLISAEDKLNDILRDRPTAYNEIIKAQQNINNLNLSIVEKQKKASEQAFDDETQRMRSRLEQLFAESSAIDRTTEAGKTAAKSNFDEQEELRAAFFTRDLERANLLLENDNNILSVKTDNINKLADIQKRVDDERLAREKIYGDKINTYFDALEAQRIADLKNSSDQELQAAATQYDNLTSLADDARKADVTAAMKRGEDVTKINEYWDGEDIKNKQEYQNKVTEITNKYNELTKDNEKLANAERLVSDEKLLEQQEINLTKSEEEKEAIRKKYAARILAAEIKLLETQRDIELRNTELTQSQRAAIIAKYNLAIAELSETTIDDTAKKEQEALLKKISEYQQSVDVVSSFVQNSTNLLSDFFNNQSDKASNARQDTYNKELESLDTLLSERLITEEEYKNKKDVLDKQAAEQEKQAKIKAFNQTKGINLANAAMQSAQAVLSAYVSGLQAGGPAGPLVGGIFAGIAGAFGAAQIALIASQKFKAARGGVVPGSGPSNVDSVDALLAPGEMVINSRSANMFPQLLSSINQAGGGISLAPDTSFVNRSSSNSNPFTPNRSNEPIQAYIVYNDLKTGSEKGERLANRGTYGR